MAAVLPADWSVDFVSGDIRFTGTTTNNTPLELHRWLGSLADDAQAAGSQDDILDISSLTPSERITDQIINLLDHTANGGPRYNINAASAEHLYGGSVKQGSGATEQLFSGLQVLGSAVQTGTQLQIVQDKVLYDGDAPFWGDQVSPFNGDAAQGILMRLLVESRTNGCDIDNKKVIVQMRNYKDTYSFFEVTLGTGESVAAVSSVDDPQNATLQATVTAYTHVTNVEGFQLINIGDGNGDQPYYSKWTYGVDTSLDGMKGIWEFVKDLTATGTAKTLHGMDGELFRGVTHTYVYDTLTGTFTEDETLVWGTAVTYDTLAGGTFTVGNYVRFGTGGNAGRIMYDNGSTLMIVALENITGTITPVDTEVMTEYNSSTGASGVSAAVDTTTAVADPTKGGGSGVLLANDTTGLKHHIQVRTGVAPVDNLPILGLSSAADCLVAGSNIPQTLSPVFLGSYVGSLIGGFGVGIDTDDLAFPDTVTDLDGDINAAPNNVTWSLNGVEVAEDRCLVGPKDAVNPDFEWDQMALDDTGLNTSGVTSVTVDAIPDNTPQTGWLRITLDDDRRFSVAYTSWTGVVFTIGSTNFTTPNNATTANAVMVAYIDKEAAADPETYTTIYTSPQTLWVRVRDGGATPIKTYEAQSSLGSAGGSATASRISDA